ncbi:hypothetical protein OVA24_07945 [Luteolibacter sp. SL250]|uniref:hypothetical protein n=1 Tax=Luteolibacter sp. SL250 TaxID=2995170 RepID=UPI00226EF9C3|nr:hypothetical protein [Luteolibacter sp. SL250]WAC21315.1 hypothetical protein OVA24_07945 [Luteolibacter sp. SL250]
MSSLRRFRLSRRWRIFLWILVGFSSVVVTVLTLAQGRIIAGIEQRMRDRLEARGLEPEWSRASWSLWRGGVVFRDFILHETEGERKQVLEVESLAVSLPPSQWISTGSRTMVWSVRRSKVVVSDAEGHIALEDVSAKFRSRRGKITVTEAKVRHRGLVVDLEGDIITRQEPLRPPPRFVMKLKAARATLAALDFDDGTGRFKIRGKFTVDASTPAFDWSASLKGNGREVSLKGVPLRDAGATAELSSQEESVINAGVAMEHGRAEAVIRRQGWKGTPFTFEGTVQDGDGKKDTLHGSHHRGKFHVAELEGDADLWSIAGDIPMLADSLPPSLEVVTFPAITARDIRWEKDGGWSVARFSTRGAGAVTVAHEGKKVDITALTGGGSLTGRTWSLREVRGEVFGGNLTVDGDYTGGRLRDAAIKASGVRLDRIKQAMGKGKTSTPGVLSLFYTGSADLGGRLFDGEGRMMLENAPVIEVPLLDQVHDLFAAIIPGVERAESGEGRFEAHFTSSGHIVSVGSFEASGGTLTVDARGQVDLRKETVSGSARGKLTGLPGVVTQPLSRLLEMEVTGTLDRIHVRRLEAGKIISQAAEGTAEVVEEAVKGVRKAEDREKRRSPSKPARWFDKWRKE